MSYTLSIPEPESQSHGLDSPLDLRKIMTSTSKPRTWLSQKTRTRVFVPYPCTGKKRQDKPEASTSGQVKKVRQGVMLRINGKIISSEQLKSNPDLGKPEWFKCTGFSGAEVTSETEERVESVGYSGGEVTESDEGVEGVGFSGGGITVESEESVLEVIVNSDGPTMVKSPDLGNNLAPGSFRYLSSSVCDRRVRKRKQSLEDVRCANHFQTEFECAQGERWKNRSESDSESAESSSTEMSRYAQVDSSESLYSLSQLHSSESGSQSSSVGSSDNASTSVLLQCKAGPMSTKQHIRSEDDPVGDSAADEAAETRRKDRRRRNKVSAKKHREARKQQAARDHLRVRQLESETIELLLENVFLRSRVMFYERLFRNPMLQPDVLAGNQFPSGSTVRELEQRRIWQQHVAAEPPAWLDMPQLAATGIQELS